MLFSIVNGAEIMGPNFGPAGMAEKHLYMDTHDGLL